MLEEKSPTVKKKAEFIMSFTEALIKLVEGKKVRRIAWDEKIEYGYLNPEGDLNVCQSGLMFIWKVNKLDITATDWVEVKETN